MSRRRRLAALVASLGLTLTLSGEVLAEPTAVANAMFNEGVTAYKAGDVKAAVDDWSKAADEGHPIAAYLVGQLYEQGRGVAQSDGLAFQYYKIAADAGHLEAMVKVGITYRDGNKAIGVKRDYQKALKLFENGALAAFPEAQYELAGMYRHGLGVPVERSESLRWLILAAKKHYVPSLLELARIHFDGEGVDRNRVMGWAFLDLATRYAQGEEQARVNAAKDKYAVRLSDTEKDAARQAADDWLARHS